MNNHKWIYYELDKFGYTYDDLSEYLGYATSTIYRYFEGTLKMPTEVLAQLLNLILIERKN